MKPREGADALEVPEEFRRENAPATGRTEWSHRRAAWYRAHGVSYLSVLQEEQRQARARRQAQ